MTKPKNIQVLVVDDLPLMRTMLVKFVKTLGKKGFSDLSGFEDVEKIEIIEAAKAECPSRSSKGMTCRSSSWI